MVPRIGLYYMRWVACATCTHVPCLANKAALGAGDAALSFTRGNPSITTSPLVVVLCPALPHRPAPMPEPYVPFAGSRSSFPTHRWGSGARKGRGVGSGLPGACTEMALPPFMHMPVFGWPAGTDHARRCCAAHAHNSEAPRLPDTRPCPATTWLQGLILGQSAHHIHFRRLLFPATRGTDYVLRSCRNPNDPLGLSETVGGALWWGARLGLASLHNCIMISERYAWAELLGHSQRPTSVHL